MPRYYSGDQDESEEDWRKRLKNSVLQPGETLRTDWTMFDGSALIRSIGNAPMFDAPAPGKLFTDSTAYHGRIAHGDPLDPLAPQARPFSVDTSSPQGAAWAENAARQRAAWQNPDAARASSYGIAPPGGSPSGAQFPGPQDTAGRPRAGSGYSDMGSGSRPSYARTVAENRDPSPLALRIAGIDPAEAARAAAERDAAREERGRIQRDSWRHPWGTQTPR
jgi:hypothetical protein